MHSDILVPLIVVGIAELGDKSQLALLLIAAQTKKHWQILLGALTGFLIVDGIAIAVGETVLSYIPYKIITVISGTLFVVLGIYTLVQQESVKKASASGRSPFLASLSLIIFSEWGDKTQLASAMLAANYNGWFVLLGVMLAMALLCTIAVFVGKFLARIANTKAITWVAGIVFIVVGLTFLVPLIFG